jgi:hypothetical protein
MAAVQALAGGGEAHKGETASSLELRCIKRATPLPLKQEMAPATPGAWPRRRRGVRGRPATHCTATHGGANGLSTPGSGPAGPARGWRAEHATRGSSAAARYVQLTAATRYPRCSPAHQACQAGPTPPAGVSGPEPGPPQPPSRPRSGVSAHTRPVLAASHVHSPGPKPDMSLHCADRPCLDDERRKVTGGAYKLRRSALHQSLRACLGCTRRQSEGKGAR